MGESMGDWKLMVAMAREALERWDAIDRLIASANRMYVPPRRQKPPLGFRLPSVDDRVEIVAGYCVGELGTIVGVGDHTFRVELDKDGFATHFRRDAVSVVAWGDA